MDLHLRRGKRAGRGRAGEEMRGGGVSGAGAGDVEGVAARLRRTLPICSLLR